MDKEVKINVSHVVDDYLDRGDFATENANGTWTPSGLLGAVGGAGLSKDNLARIEEAGFAKLAQMHKDGAVHIHDLSLGFSTPYCSGWSLQTLLAEGIGAGSVRSHPAKHLRTAVNHMINFIGAASNEFAGAQAFSDVDILLAPYAYKVYLDYVAEVGNEETAEFLTRKEVKQCIQELLFHLNYNNRWGGQTPFSNITLAITCPDDLKNSAILVAGKPLWEHGSAYKASENKTYGDMRAWQMLVIDAILDTFLEGDASGNGFTFPVLTINVTKEFFKHPVRQKIFQLAAKFGTPYFQNFINGYSAGQKINPDDVRSMCPMHGDTLVTVYTDNKGFSIQRIQDIYHNSLKGTKHKVLHNGKLIDASLVINDTIGMKKIRLANNAEVIFDIRHEQPIKRGIGSKLEIIKTSEIENGMWIPFNATKSSSLNFGSVEAGFAVGLFIGDGSYADESGIIYSLNKNTDVKNAKRVIKFFEHFGFRCTSSIDGENLTVRINGMNNGAAKSWMKQFVDGEDAHSKSLTRRSFNAGSEFLFGMIDGWYESDGGNRGRIYTVSDQLLIDFECICGLLGKHYRTSRGNPDIRNDRISDNSSPLHTLKFHTRPSYANQFFFEEGYWWYRVESIEDYEDKTRKVYCFAVDSEDHLFQLANGMVTHNCRLSINEKEIQKHVGGLFGHADQTGSLQVVTVSLPYLAAQASEIKGFRLDKTPPAIKFFDILKNVLDEIKKEQLWKREQVESFFKKGLFPISRTNLGKGFKTYFTTVGFIGLWECVEILTGNKDSLLDEEGLKLGVAILEFMREEVEEMTKDTGKLFNLEATPAESASYTLAKKAIKAFPDIVHRGLKKSPYFTNSCHIPVEYQDDLEKIFRTQNELQPIPSGGTVVHFYMGEDLSTLEAERAVKFICENTKLPYFSLTTVYSMCPICGRIPGSHEICPNEHTKEQLEELKAKYPEFCLDE